MSEPASQQPEQPGEAHHVESVELAEPAEPPRERVGPGLAAAVLALVVGAGITLAVWNLGFIASITSFVMAAGPSSSTAWRPARRRARASRPSSCWSWRASSRRSSCSSAGMPPRPTTSSAQVCLTTSS